ncbi:hypothetical protein EII17_11660 [Clostridiales bacterium COT073_COT-073]|nr:hypothetical protein EII17_11660 [Clostridiales bacterium COT073_COT-073]
MKIYKEKLVEKKCLQILGFTQRPTEKELKKAYKTLIKQHHPDVTGGETSQTYIEIDTAYKYLTGKITYREAAAILYPQVKETTQNRSQGGYSQNMGGFSQEDFENIFGKNFAGGFYTYSSDSDEYDEDGYYRQKYYTYDFSWLKWVPLILLLLFVIFMVIFFKFVSFLFTPAGLVLLAIYLLWRVFFKNKR